MANLLEPRGKCALIWHSERISYGQLIERASERAGYMPKAGARVVVFGENYPEWVYCAYAVWLAQTLLVPVDHLSTAEELTYVINDCEPELLICSEHTRKTVERALISSQYQPQVLVFENLERQAVSATTTGEVTPIVVDEAALAAIVYTSGTTGTPKGVMLSFGNLLANIRPVVSAGYFTLDARALLLLPLHHVLPLTGSLLAPLYGGSTVVFASSMAGQELLALLRRHRITVIVGVPRFYDLLHRALRDKIARNPVTRRLFALAQRIGSRAFSRVVFWSVHRKFGGKLRYLVCGGAALNPATTETFDTLGFLMCEGFGMTECAPMITFPRPEAVRLGATGQVLDGCEVRVDDNGEILARGPNVMLGYWGRPEATAAMLRDGWLHTGDLGRLDDQGYLYVTGRLKEILVLPNGKKVDPAGAENALLQSPAIREVGVTLDGETLHALVVPNWVSFPTTALVEAEAWLRREVIDPYNVTVSPYRRVQRVTLVNQELPRTRLGKLRRHLLGSIAEDVAAAAATRSHLAPATDVTLSRLVAFLERLCEKPVSASSRLQADLGLDSLGRVELAAFVERVFGITIAEAELPEFDTVDALARVVAQTSKGPVSEESLPEFSWHELLYPKSAPTLPSSSLYHRALVYLSRWAIRILFRIRASGQERLPLGPFILASNHQSYLDGVFVAAFLLPEVVLATMFYAKADHVRQAWLKALAQRCNTIIMDPKQGFLGSLQQLAAGLMRGNNLIIFPEGTRSHTGELGSFKDSYAVLAQELHIPVVPVVIDGAYAVLARGRRIPRLYRPITITYLEPLRSFERETPAEFNQRVRERILAGLAR